MTKSEHSEIQNMFDIGIAHIKEIMNLKLDFIIEQNAKSNEIIGKHTEQITVLKRELPHTAAKCPHNVTIQELRDNMITSRGIKRLMVTSITITGIIVTLIATIISHI